MARNSMLDEFVQGEMGNGEKLSMQEIKALAKEKLSKGKYNDKQISNYIYNAKCRGELQKNAEGKYYIDMTTIQEVSDNKEEGTRMFDLSGFEEFEVIVPSMSRGAKEVLSVMSSGTIAMNPALLKHFEEYSAEIRLKKDCTEIILVKNGNVMTNLGKQGRVKNYNLVDRLKHANVKLPTYFVGEWDAEKGLWHGKAMSYNPNKGKKEKQK